MTRATLPASASGLNGELAAISTDHMYKYVFDSALLGLTGYDASAYDCFLAMLPQGLANSSDALIDADATRRAILTDHASRSPVAGASNSTMDPPLSDHVPTCKKCAYVVCYSSTNSPGTGLNIAGVGSAGLLLGARACSHGCRGAERGGQDGTRGGTCEIGVCS